MFRVPEPSGGDIGVEPPTVVANARTRWSLDGCRSVRSTRDASAYLAAFWRASRIEKYTAASASSGYRPTSVRVARDRERGARGRRLAGPGRGRPRTAAAGRSRGRGRRASPRPPRCRGGGPRSGPGARSGSLPASCAGQAELHGQRDQVLLRAVVDVPLQPPPLGVLGLDDALPRESQRSACCRESWSRRARRSAASRALRTSRPACDARWSSRLASAGRSGSPGGFVTDRAPRSSPWARTATVRSLPGTRRAPPRRSDQGRAMPSRPSAVGQRRRRTSRSPPRQATPRPARRPFPRRPREPCEEGRRRSS